MRVLAMYLEHGSDKICLRSTEAKTFKDGKKKLLSSLDRGSKEFCCFYSLDEVKEVEEGVFEHLPQGSHPLTPLEMTGY